LRDAVLVTKDVVGGEGIGGVFHGVVSSEGTGNRVEDGGMFETAKSIFELKDVIQAMLPVGMILQVKLWLSESCRFLFGINKNSVSPIGGNYF